jgi:hypothetical protein
MRTMRHDETAFDLITLLDLIASTVSIQVRIN